MSEHRIPGFVGECTISAKGTTHIPDAVMRHWNMAAGDKLQFFNQFTDLPDELAADFRLIAVVVIRQGQPPTSHMPQPGLSKVRVSK